MWLTTPQWGVNRHISERGGMKKETHTIFANDIEEFAKYTSILDEFKGEHIRYIDSAMWQKLSDTFRRDIVINKLDRDQYTIINYRYSGYKYQYIYKVIPSRWISTPVEGTIVLKLTFHIGTFVVDLYAQDLVQGQAYFHQQLLPFFNKLLEEYIALPKDPRIVRVTFTYMDSSGDANISSREIICPSWGEIKPNYPLLEEHVESLLHAEQPDDLGKFIFWHGDPGTGKSFLIRALMREWKNDVDFIYVIDPERFFNDGGYMKEIIISDFRSDSEIPLTAFGESSRQQERKENAALKLFIIEDGLNFLLKESRVHESGAMSRLLNLTDGILGQGLRLLFLITSNEKEQDIDPAFLRSGRCLQKLKFEPFTSSQAKKWLKDRGKKSTWIKDKDTYTLSTLYAEINKNTLPKQQIEKARIGIRAV